MKPILARLLLLAAIVALPRFAAASVEAPDHVLYGSATVYGNPAPVGSVIELRSALDGSVLVRHTLGLDPRLGGQYSLRIPMDSVDPRLPGRSRPGEAIRIYIGPQLAAETVVGAEGVARRLDIDPRNLGAGPAVAIADAEGPEGNAGSSSLTFNLTMTTTAPVPVNIEWTTQPGSASGGLACGIAGVDYVTETSTAVIAAGSQSTTLDVLLCGDTVAEADEAFTVALTSIQNGVLADTSAVATIRDDDDLPSMGMADVRIAEPLGGTAAARFVATLSRASSAPVSVNYFTQNVSAQGGTDYVAASGTITIPAGQTQGELLVSVLPDANTESDEIFRLVLGTPVNVTLARTQVQAIIVDTTYNPAIVPEGDVIGGPGGITGLAQPSAIALSPDGLHAYVTSESLDTVLAMQRDPASGDLTLIASYNAQSPGLAGVKLDGAKDIALSPDGAHVYVAARNDNAIAVFARDAGTGVLTLVENRVDGQSGGSGAPVILGLQGVVAIHVSDDGRSLYAAGSSAGAIAVFDRSSSTGALTFVEAELNNVNDSQDAGPTVVAMTQPWSIVSSHDGAQVYVAARSGNAVLVFNREHDAGSAQFGELSYVASHQDALQGVEGVAGASGLAISADDRHVYALGESDSAVALFDRQSDGALVWRAQWRKSAPAVPGLGGPQAIVISPDGKEVFVAGFADDSLTVFTRNGGAGPQAGMLTLRQTVFDDEGEVHNMAGPAALAASSDDRHLYVAANLDNAVMVFRRLSWDSMFEDGFEAVAP
jgi:6-phosphogluconolactonase (cycloisomerase 2 family)